MAGLDFRRPHLLRDDLEYETALAEIEQLMERASAPGTPDHERLEFLSVLVERYEDEEFPMDSHTPQALVEFALEQKGLERADLHDIMGGKRGREPEPLRAL